MNDYEAYIKSSKDVADQIKKLNDRIKELEEQLATYQMNDMSLVVI